MLRLLNWIEVLACRVGRWTSLQLVKEAIDTKKAEVVMPSSGDRPQAPLQWGSCRMVHVMSKVGQLSSRRRS
jgi:hypothetical protein